MHRLAVLVDSVEIREIIVRYRSMRAPGIPKEPWVKKRKKNSLQLLQLLEILSISHSCSISRDMEGFGLQDNSSRLLSKVHGDRLKIWTFELYFCARSLMSAGGQIFSLGPASNQQVMKSQSLPVACLIIESRLV